MGSQRAGWWHLVLLLSAVVTGQAALASFRTTSVRFVGRVPATCKHQQRQQAADRATDSLRSFRYTIWNRAGDFRQTTCLFF